MALREARVHGSTAGDHVVQLFDTAESLAAAVADFVSEGLAFDDVVLVVTRPDAWMRIAQRLGRNAVDVARALDTRQLVVLDAEETLAKFTRQSWPDSERFYTGIGELVRELAGRGRLRVFGDMVDVLASDAQFSSAVALEDLWNELATTIPFSLFCGYSAVSFGPQRNKEALRLICHCHSATRVNDDDDLAAWLLS
jgi:hypothetical protein